MESDNRMMLGSVLESGSPQPSAWLHSHIAEQLVAAGGGGAAAASSAMTREDTTMAIATSEAQPRHQVRVAARGGAGAMGRDNLIIRWVG